MYLALKLEVVRKLFKSFFNEITIITLDKTNMSSIRSAVEIRLFYEINN